MEAVSYSSKYAARTVARLTFVCMFLRQSLPCSAFSAILAAVVSTLSHFQPKLQGENKTKQLKLWWLSLLSSRHLRSWNFWIVWFKTFSFHLVGCYVYLLCLISSRAFAMPWSWLRVSHQSAKCGNKLLQKNTWKVLKNKRKEAKTPHFSIIKSSNCSYTSVIFSSCHLFPI